MKKSIAIIVLILLSFGINAMAGGKSTSYVKAGGKVYFGQDLKMGLFNMKIISDDGNTVKIPNRDVEAYMHDSRLFERLPVICENNDTLCFALMEYITSRSGLKLYRYCCYETNEPRYGYYVFNNGRLYLRIDPKNALTALPFFGVDIM
jgi:hypothetical protein